MKKAVSLVAACLIAISAQAADLGLIVGGGSLSSTLKSEMSATILGITTKTASSSVANFQDFDLGLVFSSGYVQIAAGQLTRKNAGSSYNTTVTVGSTSKSSEGKNAATAESFTYIPVELLVRYPLSLGKLKLFALGGLEYDSCIGATDKDGKAVQASSITDSTGATAGFSYYNRLLAKLGLGLEIPMEGSISLKPQVLCGFGLYSPMEKDLSTYMKAHGFSAYDYSSFNISGALALSFKL